MHGDPKNRVFTAARCSRKTKHQDFPVRLLHRFLSFLYYDAFIFLNKVRLLEEETEQMNYSPYVHIRVEQMNYSPYVLIRVGYYK